MMGMVRTVPHSFFFFFYLFFFFLVAIFIICQAVKTKNPRRQAKPGSI